MDRVFFFINKKEYFNNKIIADPRFGIRGGRDAMDWLGVFIKCGIITV